MKYWCPVNLYERPQKRRVLGKRIEGVASDGMPWKKNPPPWKKVPTAWKKVPTAWKKVPTATVFTARRTAENRCYVKKFTNDVSFFTYYVSFFT